MPTLSKAEGRSEASGQRRNPPMRARNALRRGTRPASRPSVSASVRASPSSNLRSKNQVRDPRWAAEREQELVSLPQQSEFAMVSAQAVRFGRTSTSYHSAPCDYCARDPLRCGPGIASASASRSVDASSCSLVISRSTLTSRHIYHPKFVKMPHAMLLRCLSWSSECKCPPWANASPREDVALARWPRARRTTDET